MLCARLPLFSFVDVDITCCMWVCSIDDLPKLQLLLCLNILWISKIYRSLYIFVCRMDEGRQPLSRKLPIASSRLSPYRLSILVRLAVVGLFFHYRITHPVNDAYVLWLLSIICEIWFAVSWIFDQFPKWCPIRRETYLDRLSLRYA